MSSEMDESTLMGSEFQVQADDLSQQGAAVGVPTMGIQYMEVFESAPSVVDPAQTVEQTDGAVVHAAADSAAEQAEDAVDPFENISADELNTFLSELLAVQPLSVSAANALAVQPLSVAAANALAVPPLSVSAANALAVQPLSVAAANALANHVRGKFAEKLATLEIVDVPTFLIADMRDTYPTHPKAVRTFVVLAYVLAGAGEVNDRYNLDADRTRPKARRVPKGGDPVAARLHRPKVPTRLELLTRFRDCGKCRGQRKQWEFVLVDGWPGRTCFVCHDRQEEKNARLAAEKAAAGSADVAEAAEASEAAKAADEAAEAADDVVPAEEVVPQSEQLLVGERAAALLRDGPKRKRCEEDSADPGPDGKKPRALSV